VESDVDADGLWAGLWNGPNDPDSDGDGLWDGWHDNGDAVWEPGETLGEWGDPGVGGDGGFGTSPWDADTDDDGLWDGWDDRGCDGDIATMGEAEENNGQWDACEGRGETGEPGTERGGAFTADQLAQDADDDGINSGPTDPDSDEDGLFDGTEVKGHSSGFAIRGAGFVYRTSPLLADTDGDGQGDRDDPVPLDDDIDGDEFLNYMDDDMDGDGGTNFFWDDDDDNDGMTDAYETEHGVSVGGWQDPARHNQRYAIIIGVDSLPQHRESWNGLYWLRKSLVDDYEYEDDEESGFDVATDHLSMLYYQLDDDSGGFADVVDGDATFANIGSAFRDIRSRITNNDFFLFVYIGHAGMAIEGDSPGTTDFLHRNGAVYDEYGGWLRERIDELNYKRAAIIVQACAAGQWIHGGGDEEHPVPPHGRLSGPDRIVITSSETRRWSWGYVNSAIAWLSHWYFFDGFLEKLRESESLMDAFWRGRERDQNGVGPDGYAQIDDDGDGMTWENEFSGDYADPNYDPTSPLEPFDVQDPDSTTRNQAGHLGVSYWEDNNGTGNEADDMVQSYALGASDGELAQSTFL